MFLSVFAAPLFLELAFIEGTQDFPRLHLHDHAAVIDVFVLVDAVVTDDGFAKKWLDAKYYRAKRSEGHIYETLNKDMVRSKSEVIIADRLYNAGIPYHYEQRLDLEDEHFNTIKYYPDFTILNKRTREIYYWEHLGNLGDPDYCFKNLTKLEHYSDNEILLGKNLILTFESQNKPLYTANVDRLIKEFLS